MLIEWYSKTIRSTRELSLLTIFLTLFIVSVFVSGSIAFDVIFSVPQDFRASIPVENGEIRNFNAVFVAQKKKEFPGGTAGNIGFWLGIEEVPTTVFSAFGRDMREKHYLQKLQNLGIDVRGTEGEYTAHAYMVSDPLHQQLIIWQPNDYEAHESQSLLDFYTEQELKSLRYAIFSPGTAYSMERTLRELRAINDEVFILFDPGQMSHLFSKDAFEACCARSNVLIGNDIEWNYFRQFDIPTHLLCIETRGEQGLRVTDTQGSVELPAMMVDTVVETTGAGDAFRAGLIAGLYQGLSLEEALQKGQLRGAECVTLPSGQY